MSYDYDDLLLSTVRVYARPIMKRIYASLGLDSAPVDELSDEELNDFMARYAEVLSQSCPECGRPYEEEVS